MPTTHVIFDVDGVLLDTERLYTVACNNVCSEFGKTYTWEIKCQVMGMKEDAGSRRIIDMLDLPITVEEYKERIHKEYDKVFPTVPLLPGADKLVRHLHKHQVPIAVVTGSDKASFALKSQNHKEFFSIFHHLVLSGDDPDVKHGKPAPDPYLVGARRFTDNPSPSNVLVFEDAVNGVKSALAAGMPCVWIPHQEQDRTILQDQVDCTLDSLEDFKPEEFGLPPYS